MKTGPRSRQSRRFDCSSCTLHMVRVCYQRAWCFRLMREPFVWGMRLMAAWHGIHPADGVRDNPECHGCVRYMKNQLKEKSGAFRFMNARINPHFNRIRDSLLTPEEIEEARRLAGRVSWEQE